MLESNRNLLIGIIDNNSTRDLGSRKDQLNNLMGFFGKNGIIFKHFTLLSGEKEIQANFAEILTCDGLILTGSYYNISEFEDSESLITHDLKNDGENLLKYELDLILKFKRPILGICFGHQLLGYAFNNKIVRIPDEHPRNIEKSKKTTDYQMAMIEIEPGFKLLPSNQIKSYEVNLSHQDEIAAIGFPVENYSDAIVIVNHVKNLKLNDFLIFGWNPITKVIHAIQHPTRPIFGVQFHPEFDFKDINDIKLTGLTLFSEFFKLCSSFH